MNETKKKPVQLSETQEEVFEKNLVWIIGAPKSGTTWLAQLLASYDAVRLDEPLIGLHLGFIEYRGASFIRRIDKAKERSHYFFSDEYKETWLYYVRKLILNRIYAQFGDLSKKIIIKEPNGSMGSDIISQCLPNSKMILILRDGRDVLNSQVTALSKEGYAAKASKIWKPLEGKRRFGHIKRAAQEWVNLIKILMSAYTAPKDENKDISRYENLRENNNKEIKKLSQFLKSNIGDQRIQTIISKFAFKNLS